MTRKTKKAEEIADEVDEKIGEELNERQKAFADFLVKGTPVSRAFKMAGYDAKGGISAAYRLLRSNKMAAYLESERRRLAENTAAQRQELVDFLLRAIRTPVGDVDETSDLVLEYTVTETPQGRRTRVKMLNKLDALRTLASIHSWGKPGDVKKQSSAASPFSGLLELIRANPLTDEERKYG